MALDKASEEKVARWLASKGQLHCPLCKGAAWGIGDLVGTTIVPTPMTSAVLNLTGAQVSLQIQLTCLGCGYIAGFSPAPMGITGLSKPQTEGR